MGPWWTNYEVGMSVDHTVDWGQYFSRIKERCPWSYAAWHRDLIKITDWVGEVHPLDHYQARMYIVPKDLDVVEIANSLNHGEDEWLYSYPSYGEFATPVTVLIQQNRAMLSQLRENLGVEEG